MKNNVTITHIIPTGLTSLLEKAAKFHGHLGPFLAIGVRMGLIGLKKLDLQDDDQLTIEASLPLHVPFSCIIDGLQFTTQCTVGNQKLSIKDSKSIHVRFKREKDSLEVIVALDKSMFEEMKSKLLGKANPEEIQRLAWVITSMTEDELFEISLLP